MQYGHENIAEYSIDYDRLFHAIAAAVVVRLKSRGWTQKESEAALEAVCNKLRKRMQSLREQLAENIAAVAANGGGPDICENVAIATVSVFGVDVADELHNSKIAERN